MQNVSEYTTLVAVAQQDEARSELLSAMNVASFTSCGVSHVHKAARSAEEPGKTPGSPHRPPIYTANMS
jgi:hypothetical protein